MKCIICKTEKEVIWYNRCTNCETAGYSLWGFGEWCEEWREKYFTIEQQKYLILHKRNIDFDVDFKTGKVKLK